jgi:fumarate hydratase class I
MQRRRAPAEFRFAQWQPGETLLLSGKLLTGRDAAHKRIMEMLDRDEKLPSGVAFNGRFIYYVGPVDTVRDGVVGPAGPTTATRMDKFTETILAQTGHAEWKQRVGMIPLQAIE